MRIGFLVAWMASLASVAAASNIPDYPFVYAQGVAKTKLEPDVCRVTFSVQARDIDSANALKVVEERSSAILALLSENGVKREDLEAYKFEKRAVYDYSDRDQPKDVGYQVERDIEFTLHDLKSYDPIVTRLLRAEGVVNIYSQFDRTDRDDIELRLLETAVQKARAQAEIMAKGSGQRIVKLRAISQHGLENLADAFGIGEKDLYPPFNDMGPSREKDLLYVPSTVEFQNEVSVIYEIAALSETE